MIKGQKAFGWSVYVADYPLAHDLRERDLDAGVRRELDRILLSAEFSHARALWPVLLSIVQQSLESQDALLDEKSIGQTVHGEAFDSTTDSTIRVRLHDIRAKLKKYYLGSGLADPLEIRIPSGGYRARFVWRKSGPVEINQPNKAKDALPPRVAIQPFVVLTDRVPSTFGVNTALLLTQTLGGASGVLVHCLTPLPDEESNNNSAIGFLISTNFKFLVQGTICMLNGVLEVIVSTMDPTLQAITWSQAFTCESTDYGFVARIADALAVRIDRHHGFPSSRRMIPEGASASDDYCKGVRAWSERTPQKITEAEAHFHRVLAADPKHSGTYSALANCLLFRAILGERPRDLEAKAVDAASRAVACDPDSAEAHAVLGAVKCILLYEWSAGEVEFTTAERLNPDCIDLLGWYSGYLAVVCRQAEALQYARRLEILAAFAPLITAHVAKVFYFCGEYGEAIPRLEAVVHSAPRLVIAHEFLGMALCANGELERGLQSLKNAAELTRSAPAQLGALGHYLAIAGDRVAACEIANRLEALSATTYVPATQRAVVCAGLGEIEKAFRLLAEALNERDFFLTLAAFWPPLIPLRSDPRFSALLGRIGLDRRYPNLGQR